MAAGAAVGYSGKPLWEKPGLREGSACSLPKLAEGGMVWDAWPKKRRAWPRT